MRKFMALCLCGLLLSGMASLASAEREYNLYEYTPLELQMRWVYGLRSSQTKGEVVVDVEVIGEEEYEGIAVKRVRWPSGWVDLYEQSEEGLKNHKAVYKKDDKYSLYNPPALQHPKTMKMGEVFERTTLRNVYNGRDDSLIHSLLESLQFSLLAEEDVTVPAGEFKGCLKTLVDFRFFDKGDEVRRKIVLSWNAPGVGLVKKISIDLVGGSIMYMEEWQLKELVKPEPAEEEAEAEE